MESEPVPRSVAKYMLFRRTVWPSNAKRNRWQNKQVSVCFISQILKFPDYPICFRYFRTSVKLRQKTEVTEQSLHGAWAVSSRAVR